VGGKIIREQRKEQTEERERRDGRNGESDKKQKAELPLTHLALELREVLHVAANST
jgi:hypothetical protein